ncbi:MAG TPA: hypothetical protein VM890_07275 [Longimicrobium sp.]|jgi:hypothetical protein|nr:hypothetical protein [Longimicrobium sp.]
MNETLEALHRTWLQVLLETKHREVAALMIDAELEEMWETNSPYVEITLPSSAYLMVHSDPKIQSIICTSLSLTARGHITDQNGNHILKLPVVYRIKLLDIEPSWREVVRNLIVNSKDSNQALISEKLFARRRRQPFVYNEMKFASNSEIRIAQEFEQRKVLFFPLALGVRAETGELYKDHREVDFLVCDDGVWGVLEVSYHPDRFEKDSEKDVWFKHSGILCIQHYTAEKCFNEPGTVVTEFLKILAKHKR